MELAGQGVMYGTDGDPGGKEEPQIMEGSKQLERGVCHVKVDGIDRQQADNGCLWSVVDEPF